MKYPLRADWSGLGLALMLAWTAAAQNPPAVPDGSRVAGSAGDAPPPVRIDAIATDRQGRPVLDLRPLDFELRVNGVPLPLARVELRSPRDAANIAPRVFAFLLDEFHVSAGAETERVRQALTHFIDERMRPADTAVIIKPLDPVNAIKFTGDRDALRAAAASFTGRKGDFTPRSGFEEQFIGRAPATVTVARAQIVAVALTEMALQLGELNAERAAMVLVSEGFSRGALARRAPRMPDLQGVARAASRFHFAVYTFNPADPAVPAPAEPDPTQTTLQWLATETGGAAVLNGATLIAGLQRMSGELDAYYALTLPTGEADGRFHPIEVRSKRAGVSLRVRPGYWAPLSSEVRAWMTRSTESAPVLPKRGLKRSALIQAWTGVVPLPDGKQQMVASWEPVARVGGVLRSGVAATAPSGRGRAPVVVNRVELIARSASGATLFEGTLARAGEPGGKGEATRFEAPAGRIELDMRILDANGKLLDVDTRDLTVPDISRAGAPPVMSPQVIRTRTANELRSALTNPAAVPTASRSFSRAERLVLRVPVLTPGDEVRIRVQVLNRTGQPMRTLDPVDSLNGIAQYDLPLAWLPPGEYYLEFVGRTPRGDLRERMPFKVTG